MLETVTGVLVIVNPLVTAGLVSPDLMDILVTPTSGAAMSRKSTKHITGARELTSNEYVGMLQEEKRKKEEKERKKKDKEQNKEERKSLGAVIGRGRGQGQRKGRGKSKQPLRCRILDSDYHSTPPSTPPPSDIFTMYAFCNDD